jgi:hypothetical protein
MPSEALLLAGVSLKHTICRSKAGKTSAQSLVIGLSPTILSTLATMEVTSIYPAARYTTQIKKG